MSAYEFSRAPRKVPLVSTAHRSIQTEIPAPGTAEILARLDAVESRSMHGQLPIVWDDAFDYSVQDIAENEFIDFTSGIFVTNIGHSNEELIDAMDCAMLHSYTYATELRAEYLEKLTRWSGFDKAFLLSSGTEATEAALKLMRLYGQKIGKRRPGIVCIEGAFHGRTMGAQMMSGDARQRAWIGLQDPNITYIPFPNPTILEGMGGDDGSRFLEHYLPQILAARSITAEHDLCGVMLEAFQGWSATFYPPKFVQLLAEFCQYHKLLLCFDEMQSGFARTGKKFGYEHYGVTPDLICVGKGMGGGVPLSGVLGRAEIMDLPGVGEMSSTHSANPLVCAAGLAVIEEIERLGLVREAERKGKILLDRLSQIGEAHGKGLIAALHFRDADFCSRIAERCMTKGLLVVHTGRETIKIGPPLTIPDDALIEGVNVIAEAISELEAETQ